MSRENVSIHDGFERKPYLLSANTLQKIANVVTARKEGQLSFDLAFSDGSRLRAVDLTRVLREENGAFQQLTRVDLSFGEKWDELMRSNHEVSLTFAQDSPEPISLDINGKESDWVKLISSELRQLIRSEAIANDGATALLTIKLAVAMILSGLFLWPSRQLFLGSSHPHGLPPLDAVLKSPDTSLKLNYLLQRMYADTKPVDSVRLVAFFAVPITLATSLVLNVEFSFWKRLYPVNEFLIGAGEKRVGNRVHLRDKLFWVVVGLAASTLLGWLLSLR